MGSSVLTILEMSFSFRALKLLMLSYLVSGQRCGLSWWYCACQDMSGILNIRVEHWWNDNWPGKTEELLRRTCSSTIFLPYVSH